MERPDDGGDIYGDPGDGGLGDDSSFADEPLADGVARPDAPAPAGEDDPGPGFEAGDPAFERWLSAAPADDAPADPADDVGWLGAVLGDVPPLPEDCLSTDEVVDRVVAQRLDDELGL